MAYQHLLVDHQDGIVILTLNHPENLNAMTVEMGDEVTAVVRALQQDQSARVLILTGAGRGFCAGGAVGNLQNRAAGKEGGAPKDFYKRFLALRQLEIPTIAAINGPAVGAGFCIALACDLRVAAANAKMGLNFVRLGIHPGMAATFTTPHIVGMAKACEVIFTGRLYSGEEAFALGLVNRVVPADKLIDESLLWRVRSPTTRPSRSAWPNGRCIGERRSCSKRPSTSSPSTRPTRGPPQTLKKALPQCARSAHPSFAGCDRRG